MLQTGRLQRIFWP